MDTMAHFMADVALYLLALRGLFTVIGLPPVNPRWYRRGRFVEPGIGETSE